MNFEQEHCTWIQGHFAQRSGEQRRRLEQGHMHGEKLFLKKVWWPIMGSFDGLYPEYEITDFRGRAYFADFAWIQPHVKLIIEIKGFQPHVQDMDRKKYCYELNRELFMQSLGFHVISFAYDDVDQRPDLCKTLLRMLLSRYEPTTDVLAWMEKQILLLACSQASLLRPIDVQRHLNINHRTAVRYLKRLCQKEWLRPVSSGERVLYYEMVKFHFDDVVW